MNLLKEKFARHVLLQYVSTAAKSYILNYMWTAANFIIESRRLCTVAVRSEQKSASYNYPAELLVTGCGDGI